MGSLSPCLPVQCSSLSEVKALLLSCEECDSPKPVSKPESSSTFRFFAVLGSGVPFGLRRYF
eukprot:7377431-Prorocentrum_lima.AAC.1